MSWRVDEVQQHRHGCWCWPSLGFLDLPLASRTCITCTTCQIACHVQRQSNACGVDRDTAFLFLVVGVEYTGTAGLVC